MRPDPNTLLPSSEPVSYLAPDGTLSPNTPDLGLSDDDLLGFHRDMVRTRVLDTLAISLQRQGQLGVWASSRGQEAAQVGCAKAMGDNDWGFPGYREHGIALVRGVPFASLLKQYKGVWHGLYNPYEHGMATHSIPISTQLLHGTGFALAAKFKGEDTVAVTFTGEGGTSEGDFHEAVNFAAVFDAPVVFFIQNNQWAISVPRSHQSVAPTIAHKGVGYGAKGYLVDGNDILATHNVTRAALERARAGDGPSIVEAMTYRMQPHTTADDDTRYRSEDEIAAWKDKDPILRFERFLRSRGLLDDDRIEAVQQQATEEAGRVRAEVLAATAPPVEQMFDAVFTEITEPLEAQKQALLAELAEAGK